MENGKEKDPAYFMMWEPYHTWVCFWIGSFQVFSVGVLASIVVDPGVHVQFLAISAGKKTMTLGESSRRVNQSIAGKLWHHLDTIPLNKNFSVD